MPFLPKGFEWVIILLLVLIIFGPKNLPKLGKAIGNGIKGLRKGVESGKEKIDQKFEEVEEEKADSVVTEETSAVVDSVDDVEPEDDATVGKADKRTVKVKRVVKSETTASED